jgi:hypothetical protein
MNGFRAERQTEVCTKKELPYIQNSCGVLLGSGIETSIKGTRLKAMDWIEMAQD